MEVQEVAPGVYAATGLIGANVGLIKTRMGAVLIDAPFVPSQARAWRREIERLSPEGVAYIINTDFHLTHVLGTCFLLPALTVAHETAWKRLRALDPEVAIEKALEQGQGRAPDLEGQLAEVRIVQPEIAVGKTVTLWCGDRRVEVVHFGGHTPATLGVYLPEQRLLFSGDLVVNGRHPYAGDAVSKQWLESLERLHCMDIATIVPGHGQPGGPEMIGPVYDYFRDFCAQVEACFHAGHTRRETVERVKPLDAFPIPPGEEERLRRLLRSSVERVYDEYKKASIRSRQRAR